MRSVINVFIKNFNNSTRGVTPIFLKIEIKTIERITIKIKNKKEKFNIKVNKVNYKFFYFSSIKLLNYKLLY